MFWRIVFLINTDHMNSFINKLFYIVVDIVVDMNFDIVDYTMIVFALNYNYFIDIFLLNHIRI